MGRKYFVASDIHSCYTFYRQALEEQGFELDNPDHVLVLLGDLFDRGPEPKELYRFLQSIPQERRILVRGNHEDGFLYVCQNESADWTDRINGTLDTMEILAGDEINDTALFGIPYVKKHLIQNGVLSFFQSKEWLDFFQLGRYLMVHAFFPIRAYDWETGADIADFDWRHPDPGIILEWIGARWEDPLTCFHSKAFDAERKRGTILVCGHCPTRNYRKNRDDSIYREKGFIGLDGNAFRGGRVNVLVIDPEQDPLARGE